MKPSLSRSGIVKQINMTDIDANDMDEDDESIPMQRQEPLNINMNGFNEIINSDRLSRQPTMPTMLQKIQENNEYDNDDNHYQEDDEFDIDDIDDIDEEEMDSFGLGLPPLPTFNQFNHNMPRIPKLSHSHSLHFGNYRKHHRNHIQPNNNNEAQMRNNRLPKMHQDQASFSSLRQLPTLKLRSCVSAPILSAVQTSFHCGRSIKMDDQTANSAREYYEMIVNADSPYSRKKSLIYDDLVIGTKTELKMSKAELGNKKSFELKYKIGCNTQRISIASGCVLTCGRYRENDIYSGEIDESVSRIQFFILVIDNSLIVLDGWSFMGTKIISVNDKRDGLQIKSSLPNQRYVLRFNKSDRIHLRLGQDIDLIINPKECIVCMENARTIRNSCGHFVCCKDCFDQILSSDTKLCPVCRAKLGSSPSLNNNNNMNMNMNININNAHCRNNNNCTLTYNCKSYCPF